DFVPIPSESKDTSMSDSEYDLSSCDDFSPVNAPEGKSEENFKIYSNPLFEFNDEYISSDVNPLFDEVLENIENKDSTLNLILAILVLTNPRFDQSPPQEISIQDMEDLKQQYLDEIKNPEDSLIMGDEKLNTIPRKESDEFIKSSVEDFVPIPSESKDTSMSDSDDGESLSDKDVQEENFKIYSNPLFEFNDEYISSNVNPLFDEVLENIENKDSYDSNLDEPNLLVTPLFDDNEDKCFDPGDDIDEIELLLHRDPSTPKMSVASIVEGFTIEPPLKENDDLFDLESKENKWKKILYDAPIDDLMTETKFSTLGFMRKKYLQHM
nr:hypothetical protein [Tanacetum cinerariifolium]